MSLGTLSESRMATAPIATINTTAMPSVPDPKPTKNTPQVLENTVNPTNTTPTNENLVNPSNPTLSTTTVPTTTPTPTPTATPNKPCGYCTAKSITGLALQISIVLFMLALSFHFVKKV